MPYANRDLHVVELSDTDYKVTIDGKLRTSNIEAIAATQAFDPAVVATLDTSAKFSAFAPMAVEQIVNWNLDGPHRVAPGTDCQVVHADGEVWPIDLAHFGLLELDDMMIVVTAVTAALPDKKTPAERMDFPSPSLPGQPEASSPRLEGSSGSTPAVLSGVNSE